MACSSAAVYGSIAHCPGDIIAPGVRATVWFIPQADIASWPTADPKKGNYGESGQFTLVEGKKWYTIKGMKSQGNATAEPVGEKPAKSFDVTLNVFVPGLKDEVIAWANQASNDDLVFAYQQADGTIRIVGHEYGECNVNPSMATGSGSGDQVGETCAITCNMPYQPLSVSGIAALGAIDEGK